MRAKLTQAYVDKLVPPPAGRTYVWDVGLAGFGAMITSNGARSYVVQYRAGRHTRRMTLDGRMRLEDARKEARAILGEVARGIDPLAARRAASAAARNTFAAVAGEYVRQHQHLRSIEVLERMLNRLVYPEIGNKPIEEIRRLDVARLLDRVVDSSGPVQADRCLSIISAVMRWHQTRDDEFRTPIVRGMARTKPKERRRERVLNDDEIRAVWKAAEARRDVFGALVRVLLLTGARRSEAAEMRRSELVGNVWSLPAERAKNKQALVRPLSNPALAAIKSFPNLGGDFVFTVNGVNPIGGLSRLKAELDAASEVKDWVLHDLRRTARTLMSRAGIPYDVAERMLGHAMPGIRATYDRHRFFEEMQTAYEALAALIGRIVDPPSENVVMLRAE
jgi:integrase